MKKLLCLMFLMIFALSHAALATEQVPDILIVEGKTYYVKSWKLDFPLESFFAKKTRPRFSRYAAGNVGTGCWRGYVAIWSLAKGKLNIVSIDTYVDGTRKSVKDIVGDKTFADWFSGTIKVTGSPRSHRTIRSFVFVRGRLKKKSPQQGATADADKPRTGHEELTVEPKEHDAVFPHINTVYRKFNLGCIEAYCRRRGIPRLHGDRVRLFIQPMGIVAKAIEIDLTRRRLTVYPGTHSKKEIIQRPLDEEQTAEIRALVTSDEFKKIPRENKAFGYDGTSYLVEVCINDVYSWKLHWSVDDKELIEVVEKIEALARKKVTE